MTITFKYFGLLSVWFSFLVLGILIVQIIWQGGHWLNWHFITNFPSRFPERAGIYSAIWGTVSLMLMVLVISVPVGISAAIYLEEILRKNRFSRLIETNIANLAGVPSIIYGILGLTIFVRYMQLGRSLIAGSLTMSLLVLPVIIIVSREALKAVPRDIRLGAYAVGASQWQTIQSHVLPSALPGIITGIILAISRAIGETAPLIMIGALTYVAFLPESIMDPFTTLPIQIYNWVSRPQTEFHELAAAGIIILLIVLLLLNSVAVYIRFRSQKKHYR